MNKLMRINYCKLFMNISTVIERWDSLFFSLSNLAFWSKYLSEYSKIHKVIGRNTDFKEKYKGKRCFIVLNGPSINGHDLSKLKNEYVFASNYFYNAPLSKVVDPNFYCWLDAKVFDSESVLDVYNGIKSSCPNATLLLNYKANSKINFDLSTYFVYTKHIPNAFNVKGDLSGICSNFSTVAFFAIVSAIYMGFSNIYILGLDFEPGGFKHFSNLGSECLRPDQKINKEEVCGLHWGYVKAQYESYYIAKFAKKKGCNIVNLNPESNIRAFTFDIYENII